MRLKILLFISIMFVSMEFRAHDPSNYSTYIYKEAGVWNIKLSFASSGLVESLRAYYDDPSIELKDDKAFTDKVEKYLNSHVDIEVNKHFQIALINYYPFVTNHASEFIFQLEGVPSTPLYWDIHVDACSEIKIRTNMVKIKDTNDQLSYFKLNKENGYTLKLMVGEDGKFKKVI